MQYSSFAALFLTLSGASATAISSGSSSDYFDPSLTNWVEPSPRSYPTRSSRGSWSGTATASSLRGTGASSYSSVYSASSSAPAATIVPVPTTSPVSSAISSAASSAAAGASSAASSAAVPAPTANVSEFVALGCPGSKIASEAEQLVAARDFAETLFIKKDVKNAFAKYVARDLINHAYDVPGDGASTAMAKVSGLVGASAIELQSVTVGQGYATTFFKATTKMGVVAAMEQFRMVGTCLAEHWVLVQPVVNSTNPHPFF